MSFNLSICPAEINKYCSLGDVVNGTLVSSNSSLLITIIFKIINIITITIIITILGQLQLLLARRHPLGQQLLRGGVQPAAGLRGAQGQDGRGVPGLFVAVLLFLTNTGKYIIRNQNPNRSSDIETRCLV